jgi:hypothetical protein
LPWHAIQFPHPSGPLANLDTEAAIGKFVIAWGLLEIEIDAAIGDILTLSPPLQSSITANLGTKSKIEIFLSAFHTESNFFPALMLDQANKLGHDTATAAGVYRVWIAHGAPFRFNVEEIDPEADEKKKWVWAKTSARKGGVGWSIAFFTKEIFEKNTESIKELITRWNDFRIKMAPRLEVLERVRMEEEKFD